jgi:hypothetical protein
MLKTMAVGRAHSLGFAAPGPGVGYLFFPASMLPEQYEAHNKLPIPPSLCHHRCDSRARVFFR